MMSKSTTRSASIDVPNATLWLIGIMLAALALRLLFGAGLAGSDDISIAGIAIDMWDHGIHVPETHYYARFGLTLPLAAIFGIFGVGIPQLDALPLLTSLAGILLVWRLGCLLFEPAVGLAAAGALALFPMDIQYATLFFPDAIQGLLLAASLLFLLLAREKGTLWAFLAAVCWAWAYYIKVDAAFFVLILLLATALGYVSFRHLVITGLATLALVGIELVSYGALTGHPLLRMALEHRAADEVLAPGHDYRSMFTYPKVMFVIPNQSGLHYYAMAAGLILAAVRRSRPALLLAGWIAIWMLWLALGFDPLGHGLRLKPQLARYLLSFQLPMALLVGWFVLILWRRSKLLGGLLVAGAVALVALFAPLNQLSFEAARATQAAVGEALEKHWFPLYPDQQSQGIVYVMLHGSPPEDRMLTVQRHDFLTGKTVFEPIRQTPAFLLINRDFERIEGQRSLVRPIDPNSFGLRSTHIGQIDNPMPSIDYASMRLLSTLAGVLPGPLRSHIRDSTEEALRTHDVDIYRLDAVGVK